MFIDMKKIIPKKTLHRFNVTKWKWLSQVKLNVKDLGSKYEVWYFTKRNKGNYKISLTVPKRIDINDSFKCALTAYVCEGTKINKGVNTNSSGQKGKNIHITNGDYWILKLIIDEFEKIGMKRDRWRVILDLFSQHNIKKEKIWWSKKLKISLKNFYKTRMHIGDIRKAYREPHGRACIRRESVIFGAIISNLINLLITDKL